MRTVVISLSGLIGKLARGDVGFDTLQPDTLFFFNSMQGVMLPYSAYWNPTADGSPVRDLNLSGDELKALHTRLYQVLEEATADGRVMWRTSDSSTPGDRWESFQRLLGNNGLRLPQLSTNEEFYIRDRFSMGAARDFLRKHFPSEVIVVH